MGLLFNPISEGTWRFRSKSDPRWNSKGRTYVGGFVMPEACRKKLEKLKRALGEPPEDLEWGYMKD